MENQVTIDIKGLSKQYAGTKKPALKNLSLQVAAGEVYGFLGPNGAGKSTTIRMLLNFIQPTSGTAKINKMDIVTDSVAIMQQVGYLSGDFSVYPKMTGKHFLQYMSELKAPTTKAYMNELLKRFKAEPNKKMGDLSRGNRQKFGIVQAFMHQPDVLILDEPTSGLDPLMQEEFYKLIQEAKARGAAIFMSSHIMSEVQKTCDRIGVIRDGELVQELNVADMEHEAAQTFEVVFKGKAPVAELKKIKGARVQNKDDKTVLVHMHGELKGLFKVLANHDVQFIDAQSMDLENLFLGLYSEGRK